ncbi:MAG: hypothetical protein Q7K42_01415, partial [Candidatus Diapherotrites archaeon]|nr:hypothetical protein [Candidatus Diapherotrites archaeon]
MPKPRRKAQVHFTFKAHPPGERYMPRPLAKKVKTFVGEYGNPWIENMPVTMGNQPPSGKVFQRTKFDFLTDAETRGKKVVFGERVKGLQETAYFHDL